MRHVIRSVIMISRVCDEIESVGSSHRWADIIYQALLHSSGGRDTTALAEQDFRLIFPHAFVAVPLHQLQANYKSR